MVWAELNIFFKIFRYLSQELLHKYLQFCFFFFWSPILPWRGPQRRSLFYPKGSLCSPSKTVSSAEAPFYVPFWEVSQSLDKFFLRNHFWFNEGGGAEKWAKIGCLLYHFFMLRNPKGKPDSTPESFRIFHISTEEQPAVYSSVFRNWKQWKQLWEAFKCTLNNLIVKLDNIYIFVDPFWRLWSLCCTVISVNMPTPHFYRKYAHPFFEGSFLKILW